MNFNISNGGNLLFLLSCSTESDDRVQFLDIMILILKMKVLKVGDPLNDTCQGLKGAFIKTNFMNWNTVASP